MAGNGTEKTPLQSKKFVAYLVAEGTWKIILFSVLFLGIKEGAIDVYIGAVAMAVVIIAGAIEALYIGGQAGLDRYTRIAQIAVSAGQSFQMKGVATANDTKLPKAPPKPKEPPRLDADDLTPVETDEADEG